MKHEFSQLVARRRGVRLAAAAAGLLGVLGTAGCGIQSSSMKVVGAAPTSQAADDVTGTQDSSGGSNQYELYFFRDGKLTPVMRYTDATVTQEVILTALFKGPDSTDTADGYTSVIPSSLGILSYTALDQQWNYLYTHPVTMAEKAEIVCTVQADLNAPSVGTVTSEEKSWNNCIDFSQDYGAPAYLANLGSASASASPSDSGD